VVSPTHKSPAYLVEHPGFGVDFLGKELGADQGMIAPEALDLVIDENPVSFGFQVGKAFTISASSLEKRRRR
jgi:hypothetical protein